MRALPGNIPRKVPETSEALKLELRHSHLLWTEATETAEVTLDSLAHTGVSETMRAPSFGTLNTRIRLHRVASFQFF